MKTGPEQERGFQVIRRGLQFAVSAAPDGLTSGWSGGPVFPVVCSLNRFRTAVGGARPMHSSRHLE
jgi:hypothetical protein